MARPNWNRIQKLNGGKPIWRDPPPLDTPEEVWFHVPHLELRIWSRGQLFGSRPAKARGPISSRHALFRIADGLFVDIEARSGAATLRRGLLDGWFVTTSIPSDQIESELAWYRSLQFRDGTPWNASRTRVVAREYAKGSGIWWIKVDGSSVTGETMDQKTASRETAIALAEKAIAARERAGYVLQRFELMRAWNANPLPAVPKSAPPKPKVAKRPSFPDPKDAFAAVDVAVAMLRDLHHRIPKGHFIAEEIDLSDASSRARVEIQGDPGYFLLLHKRRVGRWRRSKSPSRRSGDSSWSYFLRNYGSITWILDRATCQGLEKFYCGNESGGGLSCLQINPDADQDLAEILENPGFKKLQPFHGGWHDDLSFAFDGRSMTRNGERAIVGFGESLEQLPKPVPGNRIVPFGFWLLARVRRLTGKVERNLRELL